jgi:hypothetical protein
LFHSVFRKIAVKELFMAWNPRSLAVALLVVCLLVGSWGCNAEKKPSKSGSNNASSTADSPSTVGDGSTAKTTESDASTDDPATTLAKNSADSPKSNDDNPPVLPGPKTETKPESKTKKPAKEKTAITPPAAIPKVFLSDKLKATCLVNVGDVMPDGEFRVGNEAVALDSLYGESLTVVFFWTSGPRASNEELFGDMQKDVLERYASKGLKVVGVKVGDKPENVKEIMQKSGAKFATVEDSASQYFNRIAKSEIPRVYLLDPTGKILWFDIGYARATRRELQTALKAVFGGK